MEASETRQEAKAIMKEASIANEIYNQDTDSKIDALIHKDVQSSNSKKPQGFLTILLVFHYNEKP